MTSARHALPRGNRAPDRVLIMGILNRTPDSFYDHGKYLDLDRAMSRAEEMLAEGADMIDVGGEKAGPGEPVTAEEETRRVIPAIEALRRRTDVPISVDTFKPEVARRAVEAGADIVNSIGGFSDPEMRRVAAETGAGAVIMHIRREPRVADPNPVYVDVVEEVRSFLLERAGLCLADGISADRIVIDPGPGFGKTSEQDVTLLRRLDVFTALPYPVLLAVSRKRFIGEILGLETEDRLEGSLAVAAWGTLKGVKIIRTHDVKATCRVVRMTEAVLDPDFVPEYGP
jgi:dihydropteroate synthase